MIPRGLFKGYAPVIGRTEFKERRKVVIFTDDDLSRSKLTWQKTKVVFKCIPLNVSL